MRTIAAEYPVATRLAESPSLWVLDGFLDGSTIEKLLDLFGDQAFVEQHSDHHGWGKSGFSAEVPADADPLLSAVMARVEAAVGQVSAHTATFRFRYYAEGEGHPPHVDAYTFENSRLAISILITLLEPEEGGETRFLSAKPEPLAIRQRKGRMIAWTSTLPGGADDPASSHDGAEVIRGAKGVLLAFLYLPLEKLDGRLEMG